MSLVQKIKETLNERYNLQITHSESYELRAAFDITKGRILILLLIFIIIITVLTTTFFYLGPIKSLKEQNEVEMASCKANYEKAVQIAEANQKYIDRMQKLINPVKEESEDDTTVKEDQKKEKEQEKQEREKQSQEDEKEDNKSTNTIEPERVRKVFLQPPIKGKVSSKYNVGSEHYAVDIVSTEKALIHSIADGTVILAEYNSMTGHVIGVMHRNNLISFYKHNSSNLKQAGDYVFGGESIAVIGNSGELSTGPHLHFELWYQGIPVDPEEYIKF